MEQLKPALPPLAAPDKVKVVPAQASAWFGDFVAVVGAPGCATGVAEIEFDEDVEPQVFDLEQEIVPEFAPTVTVTEEVPCPAVMTQPDGKVQFSVPLPVEVAV
jgi:hypothetical protein